MTITDYLKRIIKKQTELGYYFPTIVRPSATTQQIETTEKELGLKFNDELVELYLFADGTTIDEITPSGKTGLIPIHSLLNLKDAIAYYQNGLEPDEFFRNLKSGYRPGDKLFPFLEDGAGNCYWVDLNGTENHGRLYWTNTFGDQPDYLYESLTTLFEVIDECYQQDVFTLDQDGYLDCDYHKFGEVSRKFNPEIEYWTKYLDGAK
jgi:cell wall assembly regulator SMI1